MSYETVLLLHMTSFFASIAMVVLADSIGLLWVWGKIKRLPRRLVLSLHKLIWLGVSVSVVSGLTMFMELREYLLTVPAFYTKILFIVVLIINATLLSRHLRAALRVESFSDLSQKERTSFIISGMVSAVSWVSIFVSANLLGV
jgi:hypothetical protein